MAIRAHFAAVFLNNQEVYNHTRTFHQEVKSAGHVKQEFQNFAKEIHRDLNTADLNNEGYERAYILHDDVVYLVAKSAPKPVRCIGSVARQARRAIRVMVPDAFFDVGNDDGPTAA